MSRESFVTGDVVWAPDPYHHDDPTFEREDARPWLVVSTPSYPDQGREYICCALTSYRDDHAQLVRVGPEDWVIGPKRDGSQIDPTTVLTIHHEWAGRYLGRIAAAKANTARKMLKCYL